MPVHLGKKALEKEGLCVCISMSAQAYLYVRLGGGICKAPRKYVSRHIKALII